ncbi:MAG: hypothetical protein COT89_02325 [Candidatus Colwellbacteria bacterium CG10_big_fil_rev_8_21_14_0_10_42_22]|uniref:Orn/DAP/Arg decarboxylase 2 N-terminal domain-containing protein n=1 Tax=Candidatus Colwellbacteria bacterium CG10_big_fil_rev_8_21_14_0_10_42_22 TaxID=1974540 RepID=A0A2H0VFK5_9BACT|nr:MAG: hypothetical protein COT89_02325 [Candidatus Colwellbacteria bacterium CG10_big_fil_rev_8_21_14_0_10_42_22]
MISKNLKAQKAIVNKVLAEPVRAATGNLLPTVKSALKKRASILALTKKHQTPFYVFDQREVKKSIDEFTNAFKERMPGLQIYYAVKANDHDFLLKEVVKNGLGLDVSSGKELELAIKHGVEKIIFSGPAKSSLELRTAITNRRKTIIHLDSFGELKKLGQTLNKNQQIRAGIRVSTGHHGDWHKFGIPLTDLANFWREAKKYPGVNLSGLQCHISFNQSAEPYQKMIIEIANYLRKQFSSQELEEIKFFDFGGGFSPSLLEAEYPWTTPQGRIIQTANEYYNLHPDFNEKYYPLKPETPMEFAKGISDACKEYLDPLIQCTYMCEPGRMVAERSMHIVVRLADLKNKNFGIADGGTNLIGVWEKYEDYYSPVINFTNPSHRERKFTLYGNLCTPYDIWGFYCYANKIKEGDVMVIPFQGAYTYALANDFIKPIAPTYKI